MRWLIALAGILYNTATMAEVSNVRFSQQFSMGYLQFNVMKHRKLLEAHAAALGIPNLTVTWMTASGPDLSNDALMEGTIDVAAGGIAGLLTAWDRTRGSPREVRGIAAMSREPLLLNTRNPAIHSLRDFTTADRIAVPSRKVSAQAVLLEMAAAKEWGMASFDRLDPMTFSLSPLEATKALLQHQPDVQTAFTVPPYQYAQLADPSIHTILDSTSIVGRASGGLAWTTKQFHDENPTIYRAILDAMREATDFVAHHPTETVAYFAQDSKIPVDQDLMLRLLADPKFSYDMTPYGMATWAEFLHKIGRIQRVPDSWKTLFWPEIYDLDGN